MALDIHTSHKTFLALAAGIYLVLVLLVAILPAAQMDALYPPDDTGPEGLVLRGRELYKEYNCVTCHTQQIRGDERREGVPVIQADRRFGLDRATRAEEYRNDDPPFLGTQRIGPDLMAVGTRLPSRTWHYWHLYDPHTVSPGSNMQGLPWLFHTEETKEEGDEKVDPLFALDVTKGRLYATPDAQALVEYLLWRTRGESTR